MRNDKFDMGKAKEAKVFNKSSFYTGENFKKTLATLQVGRK